MEAGEAVGAGGVALGRSVAGSRIGVVCVV